MSDQLRLSDAERELAAADLGEHFAQGRLTVDEHSERLDQIWAAKTRGEIAPIFRDLPSAYAVRAPRATAPAQPRGSTRAGWRRSRGIPAPIFVILAVLAVIAVVTHFPLVLVGVLVWFCFFKGRSHHRWH